MLQDGNWNVTAVVDAAGSVQERYEYDPYGVVTFLSDAFSPRGASAYQWETTYTGYRFDAATGLYVVRLRILQPLLGWVQRDRITLSNLYEYVSSHPLLLIDSLGLQGGAADAQPIDSFTKAIGEFTWDKLTGAADPEGRIEFATVYKLLPGYYFDFSGALKTKLFQGCVGVTSSFLGRNLVTVHNRFCGGHCS